MPDPSCQKQIPRAGGASSVSSFQQVSGSCCCGRRRTALFPVRRSLPGDKSISHRSLMLAAMAVGESRIEGLLEGEDVLATAAALRAMGVELERTGAGSWRVWGVGVGGLAEPADVLDMGNAGTGARLLMGLLAGHGFTSFLTGDASLRSRPMRRVIEPLEPDGRQLSRPQRRPAAAGADRPHRPAADRLREPGGLGPGQVGRAAGRAARAGRHHRGRAAGLARPQRADARGHGCGGHGRAAAGRRPAGDHQRPARAAAAELRRARATRPRPAFPTVAAAVAAGSQVRLEGVGLNPLRTGLYTTLARDGGRHRDRGRAHRRRRAGGRSRDPGRGAARASRCRPSGRRR